MNFDIMKVDRMKFDPYSNHSINSEIFYGYIIISNKK